tara:strand:+ start:141 stop:542 length:402 start_codon:yes stop_codon:yes gene_type:complete
MDNLQTALDNVNKALATLNEVKLILEQQPIVTEHGDDYNVEHSDAYFDYTRNDADVKNPFTEPKDIARAETVVNPTLKTNTYSVQELVTTGWVLLDKELTNLTKEEASNKIQNLIDNESYNPADLRVIVDGQR